MSIQKHSQICFQQTLTDLSSSKDYPKLLEEWKVLRGERFEKEQDARKCICESSIRKVYRIVNKQNGLSVLVGRQCMEPIFETQLQKKMIKLSARKEFPELLLEWKLHRIEILKQDTACLCGDSLVRKVCHIMNSRNGHVATVDLSCIHKYFEQCVNFEGTHKIFDNFNKIKKDINKSANPELVQYSFKKKALSSKECDFYLKIWRKTKPSDQEKNEKIRLNKLIIELVSKENGASNNAKTKLADFYYVYGSGFTQPNRKIEFWEKSNGKAVARVLDLVNDKYEKIRKVDGNNIIIEKNTFTERKNAIEAQKQNRLFSLNPDSNLNKACPEERRSILKQLHPMGPWKVAIQAHMGKNIGYEKIIRITLYNDS